MEWLPAALGGPVSVEVARFGRGHSHRPPGGIAAPSPPEGAPVPWFSQGLASTGGLAHPRRRRSPPAPNGEGPTADASLVRCQAGLRPHQSRVPWPPGPTLADDPLGDRSLGRSIIPLMRSDASPAERVRVRDPAGQRVIDWDGAEAPGAVRWVAYAPGSYLNETRSFVRYVIPPSSARWMSCATTSATRRSRSVPLAALRAADAASSQD